MNDNNTFTSKVNVISNTFQWIFKNFNFNDCQQACILSPRFITKVNKKLCKWQLKFYPRSLKYNDHSALFLVSLEKFDVEAEFTLCFIDNKNKKLLCDLSTKYIFRGNNCGYKRFIKLCLTRKLKNFSIICTITTHIEIIKITKQNAESKMIRKNRRLHELDSLEKLIENDKFSDVSLNVKGQLFLAHKCLLANKSPVFAAMLKHTMKEKESKTVVIDDIKPEVFKEVLRFIYAGKVVEIESLCMDLFMAADKYSLEGLKDLCVVSLCDTLSVENAVKYLELADLYHLDELHIKVLDFIVERSKKFINSTELKEMGDRKPRLLFEVFQALALVMET